VNTPAALKGKKGKQAKLVLVAVAAIFAFIYMRGRGGAAPAAAASTDTGVPTTDGLATGAGNVATAGALEDPTGALAQLSAELAQFESRTNDQFGHFVDLENAYGDWKAGNDPFGTGTDGGGGILAGVGTDGGPMEPSPFPEAIQALIDKQPALRASTINRFTAATKKATASPVPKATHPPAKPKAKSKKKPKRRTTRRTYSLGGGTRPPLATATKTPTPGSSLNKVFQQS
jgi:hypothetical protein